MKTQIKISLLLAFAAIFLLPACERDWNNPWDEFNNLSPEAWALQNLQIEDVSITEKKLTWTYDNYNIEGFKIDRKKGSDSWQVAYQTLPKEARNWSDTEIIPDPSLTYSYLAYSFAEKNISIQQSTGGLVCALNDQRSGAEWGCILQSIGGTSTIVDTGASNTTKIVSGCTDAGMAAPLCYDLVLNCYDDWFLPSKDELNIMYQNLKFKGLGGFIDNGYWSS